MKTYQETIDWLFQQFPSYQNIGANAYKPSLDNIEKLCAAFGNPQNDLKFIHVAGTNGKGSTCSILASILKEQGYKTGLFTSPHIQDFRERIRVNGQMTPESFVIKATNKIKNTELDFEPSFFEISFLLALLYFQDQECDICVIETGLGGRLDATNVITPILSLITNISIEHTQFLGNTIQSIASEKAGIIKPHVPIITAEKKDEALVVFNQKASEVNAPFGKMTEFTIPDSFPLLGTYQKDNFNLAMSGLDCIKELFPVTDVAIDKGLKNLTKNSGLFGRLQIVDSDPTLIFDVSHNTDGIEKTLSFIQKNVKGNLHLLYGTSADKNLEEIFPLLKSAKANYYFTTFSNSRSAKMDQLRLKADEFEIEGLFFENPKKALEHVQSIANKEDTILVFGSFFLIADFF